MDGEKYMLREIRKLLPILIGLGCSVLALFAQDSQLDRLRATLVPLRAHANDRLSSDHGDTRGATPALTVAKHRLRDWIETRLAKFPENGDADMLAAEFHAALTAEHLFCDDCFPSFLGYVDEVQVNREQDLLIVRTSAGIWCGYDDSAYAYQWSGGRWQRVWEDEQNVYTSEKYLPRILYAVHVSPPDSNGHRLVMTLGSRPGCSVAFQPVYYGVWQLGAIREKPKVLLQGTEFAYVGEFPPIKGRLGPDDALIEFTLGGTGYGEGHEAVRHYKVRGDKMEQVDPIAPNPRDFVEEWLDAKWERSASWSESSSLKTLHDKLHRDDGMGDFPDPTQHCSSSSDLWQVGIKLQDVQGETWYLVRRKAPDGFSMVAISDRPNADCTEKARDTDWPRTLFPGVN
jgi:hypothetical protein